jgi:hypothetical protein
MMTTANLSCNKIINSSRVLLHKYLAFINSPSRREAIMKLVQYTLWMLSRYHYTKNTRQQQHKTSAMGESLAVLSGEISWARYLLRFFGLPASLEGIDSGSWAADSKLLGKAMAWTMVGYFPLEHIAYLYWKAPKVQWMPSVSPWGMWRRGSIGDAENVCPAPSDIAAKASAWSCRFWFAYIVLDIARSMIVLKREKAEIDEKKKAIGQKDGNGNVDGSDQEEQNAVVRYERLHILRNALYVLPAIHWSLPNWATDPWLPDDVVYGLCWVESVVGIYQAVRSF